MDPAAGEIQYRRHAIPVDILDELAARKVSARIFDNEPARFTKTITFPKHLKFGLTRVVFDFSNFFCRKSHDTVLFYRQVYH